MPSFLLILFLLYSLILQSICVVAQTKSTIIVGDSFTADTNTSQWLLSPSGDFAFGFLSLKGTDLFLLSIWYAKISEKTVVWYANEDSSAPKGSKVELTSNIGLMLTSPSGDLLWNTEGLPNRVFRGVFNDTGNFVLQDGKFNNLWETFNFPRDTLLPSQVLEKGVKLRSKLKETDFSKGRFELVLENDGDLVMYSINLPSAYANENYYESQTVRSDRSSGGTQLVFDRLGDMYVLKENNEKFNMSGKNGEDDQSSKVSTTDFYVRATLNFDGVFTLYKHPKSSTKSEGWTTVWSKPDNICFYIVSSGSGVCGYNSICTLGDGKRPTCQCPKSYSLVDPDDPFSSCNPDFIQGCAEDELNKKLDDLYDFEILINTDWPLSDVALLKPFTEEQCRKACMDDCMCSVAIFRLGDSCWKKKLPLSNGRYDPTLNGAKAFLKVRKYNLDTKSTLVIGDSFTADTNTSQWLLSPSGDFAFGFLPLNHTDMFLLSIWYAKISEKTVVWYANGDSPAPKGSKVELNANDGLVLATPNGVKLWNTTQELSGDVSHGVFNDTGNFVLQDGKFNNLWETFNFPRDTLLPSQVLGKGVKLRSKLKETDFSKGRFELVLESDGDLVMYSINIPSAYANENYYESKTVGSNKSSGGTQLVFDRLGNMYVLRENNEKFNMSGKKGEDEESSRVSTTDFHLKATLNLDGVFSLFKHPKNSTDSRGWTTVWSQPEDICSYIAVAGSGVCGYNSFCTLGDDKRPTCHCPQSYSLVDPGDPHGGCKPDFIQGCAEDALSTKTKDLYYFENLTNTDWPLSDATLLKPFTEELCMKACMEDCLCSVAIFRSGDSCWKKKLPLSNGKYDPTLNGAKAFLKVRKDNTSLILSPIPVKVNKSNNRETLILVVSVLFGTSAILNVALIVAICVSTSMILQYKKKIRRVSKSDTGVEINLRCFTYEELEEATNGFNKELGRGAFGIVYEGVINKYSETRMAVKKLNNSLLDQAHKEFRNEVNAIGVTHHKNLVRLLGFCEGGSERLLVYEYMSNGTLANFLFNAEKQKPNWKLRLEIAIGVARGLVYLHEECVTRIIHCDIKPQNILLDDYFSARISDFGLAKLLNMNESKTNTGIRGTKGYLAVEWFKNMPITAMVDVYSYGVVLLEIISCRKCVLQVDQGDEEKAILTDWAYDCYRDGVVDALVVGDSEALDDKEKLEKLVMIAIWCVQEDPSLRPSMKNVLHMLEGTVEVQVPPYPSPVSIQYSLI